MGNKIISKFFIKPKTAIIIAIILVVLIIFGNLNIQQAFGLVFLIVVFVSIKGAIKYIRYGYKNKCNECKKWHAMEKIDEEYLKEKQTIITETRHHRNSKNEIISSWEVDVPATDYYYRIYRKCKYCNYQDDYIHINTVKN
jgi:hypothetical protein